MNKFKFFGSIMMAAVFALGLASCEKEDFNTKVDIEGDEIIIPGDEPEKKGDAVISVQPTVWALIDGEISNVTSESTITYNGKAKLEYTVNSDQGTSAMTVAIVATYDAKVGDETKTLTATANIEVPALSAGQVYVVSPTLIMRAQSDVDIPELPEGYKPGDAVISIQPEVLALINGELKNVTSEADVTFNGAEKFTYTVNEDKGTSEMTVKIDASYATTIDGEAMTLTATTTITIPALSAGQVAIFMPQLIVSYNSEETPGGDTPGGDTPGGEPLPGLIFSQQELPVKPEIKHFDYKNSSNYYYDDYEFKAKYEWGSTLESKEIYATKHSAKVDSYIAGLVHTFEREITLGKQLMYANSITCVEIEIIYKKTKYTVQEFEPSVHTRANGAIVAEFIIKKADAYNILKSTSININGHGHGSSSHSHGHGNGHSHGHGADNAGGGIVWPM